MPLSCLILNPITNTKYSTQFKIRFDFEALLENPVEVPKAKANKPV